MRHSIIAFLVAGSLLSTPVLATAQSGRQDRAPTVAALEQRADAMRQRTAGRKISMVQWSEMQQQKAEIRRLIHRLEAGETVDPQDVDRLLRQSR